ncbi:MAG: aminotransferase class I/II-fold pyridoxal phosphate-dependent enzyme, partial [Planctomycetota bacterium]
QRRTPRRVGARLARHRGRHGRTVIVTDAVFSMDGDLAPLERIVQLSQQYEAILVIDEAHGTGVLGQRGRGAAELLGVEQQVDLVVGTLSKALGGLGGFIAAGDLLIRQIRNTARPYIYTTAPPPAICRALVESLRIVRDQPQRRRKLLALADRLRRKLGQMHLSAGDSASQIIPIVIGEAGDAVAVSQHLLEAGFLVPAIRPPTVPRGSSRLRVSLCSGHTEADIDAFCRALPEALAACGVRTGQVKP